MRLLCIVAAFTILCMFAVSAVTDYLAEAYLAQTSPPRPRRVHFITEVSLALKHAQDCRQAYLVTGESTYLDAYRAACNEMDSKMDRLVAKDYEMSSRLANAEDLRDFVHAKLSEIGRTLESSAGTKAPGGVTAADPDLVRIQKVLDLLAHQELSDSSSELEAARKRTLFHRDLVIALAVINALFLGGMTICAIQIGKLYSLITMCAWSKRVQYKDQWIPLEEYLCNRFGIRISHGISRQAFENWDFKAQADLSAPEQPARPVTERPPKAAA